MLIFTFNFVYQNWEWKSDYTFPLKTLFNVNLNITATILAANSTKWELSNEAPNDTAPQVAVKLQVDTVQGSKKCFGNWKKSKCYNFDSAID